MNRLFRLLPFLFFLVTACLAQTPPDMVQARLVSEQTAVVPGQAFTVGLHLKHKTGWHTYWQNPGDVGIPPMFAWKLPAGWEAGPVQYQAPQKVKMFDITAYGFSGTEALHLVELTPPAHIDSPHVELAADITWMLCGRSCHPGTYPFSLTMPVANRSEPVKKWREAFASVRDDHPRPSEAWTCTARNEGQTIVLEMRPGKDANHKPGPPVFYGLDKQVFSNRPHLFERAGKKGTVLRFRLPRTDYGPKNKADLEAVVHCPKGWLSDGSLRYLHITVPFADE